MATAQTNSMSNGFKFAEYSDDSTSGLIPSLVTDNLKANRYSLTVAGLGDSITFQANGGVTLTKRAIGYLTQAEILSKGKIYFDITTNFGVSGETLSQILNRTPAAIQVMKSKGIQVCIVHGGTNDVSDVSGTTNTYQTSKNAFTSICNMLLYAGITPVVMPILPRAFGTPGVAITSSQQKRLQRIANMQRDYVSNTPGTILVDPTLNWTDQSNALAYPLGSDGSTIGTRPVTAITSDDLHPSHRGAFKLGLLLVSALQSRLDALITRTWSQADVFDVTDNPSGALLLNPLLVGTTGTAGTGASGSFATSFTAQRSGGTTGTIVGSKGTIAIDNVNTYPTQILTCAVTGGSPTETFKFFQQVFSNSPIGSVIYGECDISISGVGTDSFKSILLNCTDGVNVSLANQNDAGYCPNESWSGTLRTMPFTVSAANVVSLTLQIQLDGTVAGAAVVVTVSKMTARRVTS